MSFNQSAEVAILGPEMNTYDHTCISPGDDLRTATGLLQSPAISWHSTDCFPIVMEDSSLPEMFESFPTRSLPLRTQIYPGITPSFSMSDVDLEYPPAPVEGKIERKFILVNGSPTQSSNKLRPPAEEWETRKKDILTLYGKCPLSTVAAKMAKCGFEASVPMYKRQFKKWDCHKYRRRLNRNLENNAQLCPQTHLSDVSAQESSVRSDNLACTGATRKESITTSHPGGQKLTRLNSAGRESFTLTIPTAMRNTLLDGQVENLLFQVRSLYQGSIDQNLWQISNPLKNQEDTHTNLLSEVRVALRYWADLSPDVGRRALEKAFVTLETVVSSCGLFSLPSIWEPYLRMRRQGHPEIAKMFLLHVLNLWVFRFHHNQNHPFVRAILVIREIEKTHPHILEQVISRTYRSCVRYVTERLSSSHLTTLSLWSSYVAYFDSSSANEAKEIVDKFTLKIQLSEESKTVDDDVVLDTLSLRLYVLCFVNAMAGEAERVAWDTLFRIERRMEAGEALQGNLLIRWKDVKVILGQLCYMRGDPKMAVIHLEDYLTRPLDGDWDDEVLQNLEQYYFGLGQADKAHEIRERRIFSLQRSLNFHS